MAKKAVAAKKRVVKVDAVGQLHVHSSFNNVIVTLTNGEGEVISWSSAGKMGYEKKNRNIDKRCSHIRLSKDGADAELIVLKKR